MKIAIVNKHITQTVGGSELQCDFLARGLTDRGHDVVYFAPAGKTQELAGCIYKVVALSNTAGTLANAVLSDRPDIVYWRYNKQHFRSVSLALEKAGIPIIFAVAHINDLLPWAVKPGSAGIPGSLRHIIKRIRARWEHAGFKSVQALTTNNSDLLPLSPIANSHFIPNGMSNEVTPFTWPRPYVIWVANIKPAKRPELFVEATRALAEHGIDGLMVGHIQSAGYEWLSEPERVPSNFHYLGPRTLEEVNGLLATSRIQVHTCQPEGFPNIFIQAWMQGRPSVSLEFDPCGYIKDQGLGAVAGGDMETFVQQVVGWATNPEKADEAGQRAQAFARETFSVDTMVDRVEQLMKTLVVKD